MKKAAIGMLVVLALTFGPVPMGESAKVTYTGCINRIEHRLNVARGYASVSVVVGNKRLNFWEGDKMSKIKVGGFRRFLKPSELAAREPLLRQFRAGAAAKVKAKVWYNDSTNAVTEFSIRFNTPC